MLVRRVLVVALTLAMLCATAIGYLLYAKQMTVSSDAPVIGGPFRLTTHDGKILSSEDLAGMPFAVFFGFTHCPEVCPTTLSEISHVFDDLGDEAEDLTVLFVTVDPERDTPEVLRDYVSSFSGRIIGLSGTPDEIAKVAKEYRVYYEKVPTSDGGYTMNHSAAIYLMGRDGAFKDAVGFGVDHQQVLAKFRSLLVSG
jgi:protein SCO1/2